MTMVSGRQQQPVGGDGGQAVVFRAADTHRIVDRAGTEIWATSEARGWSNLYLSLQLEGQFAGEFPGLPHHLLVVALGPPAEVLLQVDGAAWRATMRGGESVLFPGGSRFSVELRDRTFETAHLYLHQRFLAAVATELCGDRDVRLEVMPRVVVRDPQLELPVRALAGGLLDGGECSTLYADCLAHALAVRLLEMSSDREQGGPPGAPRKTLAPTRRIDPRLRRAADYLRDNLAAEIDLTTLARVANLTPVYFARRFKLAFGLPPHRFQRRLRTERARELLLGSDAKIATIAADCGFCHQEHLSRVFKEHYGVSPGAYRRAVRH